MTTILKLKRAFLFKFLFNRCETNERIRKPKNILILLRKRNKINNTIIDNKDKKKFNEEINVYIPESVS